MTLKKIQDLYTSWNFQVTYLCYLFSFSLKNWVDCIEVLKLKKINVKNLATNCICQIELLRNKLFFFKSCELRHSWSRFKFWCNSTISFYIFTSLSHLYLLNLSGLSKIQPVCLSELSECLYRAVKFRKFQKRKTTDQVGFTFFPIFVLICVTVEYKIIPWDVVYGE